MKLIDIQGWIMGYWKVAERFRSPNWIQCLANWTKNIDRDEPSEEKLRGRHWVPSNVDVKWWIVGSPGRNSLKAPPNKDQPERC